MLRALAVIVPLLLLATCLSEADPCDGVSCPEDRICIALQRGTTCACADPAVEVDGECVEDGAEGEGE